MVDVMEKREEIVDFIKEVGPTLPIRVAKRIEMEPLFVSAILNEMVKDGVIKLSNMRRGSSSFYILPGQEERLCEFADEELGDDRPAYRLLKENKYLKDSEQEPQIRVSLRKIKDFAVPFKQDDELFWKFVFVSNEEIEELLDDQKVENSDNQEAASENKEKVVSEDKSEKEEKEVEKIFEEDSEEEIEIAEEDKSEILLEVEKYLKKKGKEFKKIIEFNKNEVIGIVDSKTDFGEVSFLLIAKSKKTFSDADVLLVNDRASREKMPLYLLLKGKPTKKALKVFEDYESLIIVENF